MTIFGKIKIGIPAFFALAMVPAAIVLGMSPPDTIVLDSLSRVYGGVVFDHAMHEDVADCAACHHHTTGTPSPDMKCNRCHTHTAETGVVACRDCHAAEPFSAGYLKSKKSDIHRYHTDQLGLKGAYHQSCIGCHQELGAPAGCLDCHTRTEAGDELFHAGAFSPKEAGSR